MRKFVHRPVQAIIQRSKKSFRANLLLGGHVQLPGQESDDAPLDVVPQETVHLGSYRVIVESEVVHSQDSIQLDEFKNLRCLEKMSKFEVCWYMGHILKLNFLQRVQNFLW